MMNYKQILEYAAKGLTAEIEELEKTVRQGYALVKQIDDGEKVKTPKSRYEILEICREKSKEIERLDKERFELRWELSEMNEKGQK